MDRDSFREVLARAEPRKLALVERVLPTASLLDAGGMWGVHGAYALHAALCGTPRVVVADTLETPEFRAWQARVPQVELYPADLNDVGRISTLPAVETTICFEVVMHQPLPLLTLYGLTTCTSRRILLAASVLAEDRFAHANSAVFLPALPADQRDALHPCPGDPSFQVFSSDPARARTNPEWHWALSPSILCAFMAYLGWRPEDQHAEPFHGSWQWWWASFVPDPDLRI